ncbi:MAG TPA: hypothetical protein VNL94_06895 [Candidatus Binatia bacterium]|nr:hypothetical protein [Candidatus Binatia bacterium]
MSDPPAAHADPHAADGMVGEHGQPTDQGDGHGHDDHAHGAEALGPIDVPAWGAAILGIVLGLIVVGALLLATT